jgi:hypothetical protein
LISSIQFRHSDLRWHFPLNIPLTVDVERQAVGFKSGIDSLQKKKMETTISSQPDLSVAVFSEFDYDRDHKIEVRNGQEAFLTSF